MKIPKTKKIILELKYNESYIDKKTGAYYGGVKEPLYMRELQIDVCEDEDYDFEKDAFVPNGKIAMEISGSDRALKQFGKYLINVAMYKTLDTNYHDHFDDLHDSEGNSDINLVVRKQGEK